VCILRVGSEDFAGGGSFPFASGGRGGMVGGFPLKLNP